ncbi:MAG: DUF4199 domain-containing protein [Saprospiraceae bacterium]|nr:DUF4199 domain-containing protein [Saprospiraceae bacterium]
MTTLDNPNAPITSGDPSPWPVAMRYGLITGLALVVVSLATQLTGVVDPATGKNSWIALLISVAIMVWGMSAAITKHRDENLGGYISYGKALGIGALTALIFMVISSIYTLLYFTVIDPGIVDQIYDAAVANMEDQGMSDEQIEQSMKFMSWMMNPALMTIMGFISNYFIAFIIDLIVAAVNSKKPPEAA